MRCPFCEAPKESLKVIDSRTCEGGRAVRRRRECEACGKRFTTYERVEELIRLTVVKKDGSRVPWDRARVVQGVERACYKRPVTAEQLHTLVDDLEEEIFRKNDKEVASAEIGRQVAERLRRLDQVAYVRFASVYRQFRTLEDLVHEARAVMDSRPDADIPGQGRLFLDEAGNGKPDGAAAARGRTEHHPKM